jgi:hypothetical protein
MPQAVKLRVTFHLNSIRQTLLNTRVLLSVGFTFQPRSGQIAPDFKVKICGQIALNGKNYPYYNTQILNIVAFQALAIAVTYRRIEVKLR